MQPAKAPFLVLKTTCPGPCPHKQIYQQLLNATALQTSCFGHWCTQGMLSQGVEAGEALTRLQVQIASYKASAAGVWCHMAGCIAAHDVFCCASG